MLMTDGLPAAQRRRAIVSIILSVMMAVLDSSIANVALPTMATELHASPASAVWVVNAYQLAICVCLLPMAFLGDAIGYRKVFVSGLIGFTVASLGCALAPSLPALAAARVIQGFGAAGVMSVNTALTRYIFPRDKLGQGLGWVALSVAVSSAAGPSVASGILSIAPWPWLFAVNVPLGLAALAFSRPLPATPRSGHRLDRLSVMLNAVTLALFILALDGYGQGQPTWLTVAELAVSLTLGTVYVRRQRRLAAPMLPVDLFRRPVFTLSVITSVACYCAQTLAFIALPFLFQAAGGMSQTDTGLLMTPWPLIVVFVAPLAGRLSDRVSAGLLGGIGLAALTIGLLLVAALPAHSATLDLVWRMALCGAGFGLFQTPNNRLLMTSVPRERSGAGSGMMSMARLTGQTIGGALVAVVFGVTAATGGSTAQGALAAVTLAAGFSAAAAVASSLRLLRRAEAADAPGPSTTAPR